MKYTPQKPFAIVQIALVQTVFAQIVLRADCTRAECAHLLRQSTTTVLNIFFLSRYLKKDSLKRLLYINKEE